MVSECLEIAIIRSPQNVEWGERSYTVHGDRRDESCRINWIDSMVGLDE